MNIFGPRPRVLAGRQYCATIVHLRLVLPCHVAQSLGSLDIDFLQISPRLSLHLAVLLLVMRRVLVTP